MPTYIVRGKATIQTVLQIERRVVADSPALARLRLDAFVKARYGTDVKIDSCEVEGEHGKAQGSLGGGGD
jgi:hypothetical protein